MTSVSSIDGSRRGLLRWAYALEYTTLGWNVVGLVLLAIAALQAHSIALGGFGLDSLIEIGASTVVLWQLSGSGGDRQQRALRSIGVAFALLAAYLAVQSSLILSTGFRASTSWLGLSWTALTALVMLGLAVGKARTGRALDNAVLRTEGRVTAVDAILAAAVVLGLALDRSLGWWWADPAAAYVIVLYGAREAWTVLRHQRVSEEVST